MRADLIITDGRVVTMAPVFPIAGAVAITGDKIMAVGSSEEIMELARPGAGRISAAGHTVLPGIVDAHNHVRLGSNPAAVSLTGATSLAEIRGRIAGHLADHPGLGWVEGEGWNYAAVPGRKPAAAMIDEVCAGTPAWLFSYDVHTVWLNTAALRRWGASAAHPEVPFGTLELDPASGEPTGWVPAKAFYDDDRLRAGPVKLYIDDVIEPHTAAMLAPYANAPGRGGTYWTPGEFAELIITLEKLGLQAFVHATGDRGIRTVLDGVQAARAAHGPRDVRHQIVHVECLDAADIPRFAELGVVACMQPRHCAPGLVRDWRANVGPARERYAWAMRGLADAGAVLAFSSDWNVAEMDPLLGIYTALTRADPDGTGAWNTRETLGLDTTLRAYTHGGAYANFADHDRGMLRAGLLADVIVLSEDLRQIPPRAIPQAVVTHTIVDGEIIHSSR